MCSPWFLHVGGDVAFPPTVPEDPQTRIRGTLNNGTSAQVIRHPRTTFGALIVNVNKRSISADAGAFIPNYQLSVDLFNSKRTDEG